MKKIFFVFLLIITIGFFSLKAQNNLNFKIGLFVPSLSSDLWDVNIENLTFNKEDFRDVYYAMEYEFFINRKLSLSFETGRYKHEEYSMYRDYEYDDGSPIYQNLSLKITSFELNFKIYPMGTRARIYPFIGGGAGLYAWKYEQWGDFIDFEDGTISDGYAESDKLSIGFNGRAGIVFRIRRSFGISVEARYIYLKDDLSSYFEGFEKLDMSGLTFNFGVNFFF